MVRFGVGLCASVAALVGGYVLGGADAVLLGHSVSASLIVVLYATLFGIGCRLLRTRVENLKD